MQEGIDSILSSREVTIESEAQRAASEQAKDCFSDESPTKMACPVSDIIGRISDKWSVHTIMTLGQVERMRFTELKKTIDGISQRMLTVTLRNLEQDGLLTRTVYPEIPPRVEYQLTRLGHSLLVQLMSLSNWARQHMDEILRARQKGQSQTGRS